METVTNHIQYQNIDNVEERIFPFYKGKYMGTENVGFSSEASARKFMKEIPKEDVYAACFGSYENYFNGHAYLYEISDKVLHQHKEHCPELRDYDVKKLVMLKDYDEETQKRIVSLVKQIRIYSGWHDVDFGMALDFEREFGLFPSIWVDNKDYAKAYGKFVRANVEFKRGLLHKKIELLD